jgi:hypothetical protein
MAPKSPAKSGQKKAASPKQKTPAKKAKSEEQEAPAAGEEEEEELEVGEGDAAAAEAGAEPAAGEGVAAHTRAKEGGTPAGAGKGMAAATASNLLPAATITDILLGDHRDTVALLKHFEEVSGQAGGWLRAAQWGRGCREPAAGWAGGHATGCPTERAKGFVLSVPTTLHPPHPPRDRPHPPALPLPLLSVPACLPALPCLPACRCLAAATSC